MKLSELQSKDIVSMDGKLIGNIVDIEIEDGYIKNIVAEKGRFIFSMFSSKDEVSIKWNQIKTIGEDIILVEF